MADTHSINLTHEQADLILDALQSACDAEGSAYSAEISAVFDIVLQQFDAQHKQAANTWANGFGVWHARVPRNCASPLIAARRALRDELEQRENNVARYVWLDAVRVPELDTDDTVVYRENMGDAD